MKNFIERHPDITSITCTVLFLVAMALLTFSCKSGQRIVEVTKTDTLHVYHTDTLRVVHNDTIYSIVTQVVHDSIIRETIIKEVVDELGNVIHSEKETNNETFHNSVGYSQLIQHTVDSLLKVKMDSIYHSGEKPVVVEVEKPTPWYKKAWNWIVGKFAWIGLAFVIAFLIYIFVKFIKPKI